MQDNELASIKHQFQELGSGKNRRPTESILTILQASNEKFKSSLNSKCKWGTTCSRRNYSIRQCGS
jgi:hypothetical protein